MSDDQAPTRTARSTKRRRLYVFAGVVVLAALVGIAWRAATAPHYYSTSRSLAVVAFPDPDHAWVAGDIWTNGGTSITGGVIESTANGGTTWKLQTSSGQWSDPTSVAFANTRCGWMLQSWNVANQPNVLLATTDGGVTWRSQDLGTQASIFGIACAGAAHAWAVGWAGANGGVILATRDGGVHWRKQYLTSRGNLNEVAFADVRHGWAVGDGVIVATSDGGAHWKLQDRVPQYYLNDVVCADASHAWAIGNDGSSRGVILATADGGATWEVQYARKGYLLSLAFAGAMHGWAVGLNGTILATTDGGDSWKRQRSGTGLDLYDVAFADGRHGIVVGDSFQGDDPLAQKLNGSIILRTTDGGATWTH